MTLGQLPGRPYGATWRNGMIAFGVNTPDVAGIQAVPGSGGTLRTLVTGDPKKERVMQPQLLADGKHVLFVSVPSGLSQAEEGQIVVEALNGLHVDLGDKSRRRNWRQLARCRRGRQ